MGSSLFRKFMKAANLAPSIEENEHQYAIKAMSLEAIVEKYERLSALPSLTDAQAEELQAILDVAINHEELNSKLEAVDEYLAHDKGLMSQANRESYQDQQALLIEHAGIPIRHKGAALDQQDVDGRMERRLGDSPNQGTGPSRQFHNK